MNWLSFLLWLTGIYGLYYGVLIVMDILHQRRAPEKEAALELAFSEVVHNTVPQRVGVAIDDEDDRPEKMDSNGITATGGVSIKDIFTLARSEAIACYSRVSF